MTKRFSHGLSVTAASTFEKEETLGTNSNSSYVTPSPPLINDVFNYANLERRPSRFSESRQGALTLAIDTELGTEVETLYALSTRADQWFRARQLIEATRENISQNV